MQRYHDEHGAPEEKGDDTEPEDEEGGNDNAKAVLPGIDIEHQVQTRVRWYTWIQL
jgi:hypothetical protein